MNVHENTQNSESRSSHSQHCELRQLYRPGISSSVIDIAFDSYLPVTRTHEYRLVNYSMHFLRFCFGFIAPCLTFQLLFTLNHGVDGDRITA